MVPVSRMFSRGLVSPAGLARRWGVQPFHVYAWDAMGAAIDRDDLETYLDLYGVYACDVHTLLVQYPDIHACRCKCPVTGVAPDLRESLIAL